MTLIVLKLNKILLKSNNKIHLILLLFNINKIH